MKYGILYKKIMVEINFEELNIGDIIRREDSGSIIEGIITNIHSLTTYDIQNCNESNPFNWILKEKYIKFCAVDIYGYITYENGDKDFGNISANIKNGKFYKFGKNK